MLGWRVGVTESNDWNVDIRRFLDSLGVGTGIGDNDQTGLLERSGDVIGEISGGETTSDSNGTSVRGELEDSTLTIRTS